ncbi:uncharacterized protein BDZ99DRAFT_361846, partial [Mytilinidion resinicola]
LNSPTPSIMAETKSVRFLILSDTHDLTLETESNKTSLGQPFPEIEVLLHCGDLTEICSLEGLRRAVDLISAIPAELRICIAGNHDTILDRNFHFANAGSLSDHEEALKIMADGAIRYLAEGSHSFTLASGATFNVFASPYTPSQYGPQYGLHAFQHSSGEDRYNPSTVTPTYAKNTSNPTSTIPDFPAIDIVMTHGPPKYILDSTTDGRTSAGCEHLRRAICRARPRLHCFGHIHSGYGAQRVAWKDSVSSTELEELGIDDQSSQDDDMILIPRPEPEGLMKNSDRRRGYVKLSHSTREALVHGKQTLMVNAAIIDSESQTHNAPWLVELDL